MSVSMLLGGAMIAGSASSGTRAGTAPDATLAPSSAFSTLGALARGASATTAVVTPTVLHFNGAPTEDADCTGEGTADVLSDACSNLVPGSGTLSTGLGHWDPPNPALNGANARNIYDPNWLWVLSTSPTTLEGNMTVEWWASCGACGASILTAEWNIRIWVDANGQTGLLPAFQEVVERTPALPNVPEKLSATVTLPELTASTDFILHVDPVFLDTQQGTHVYYDSQSPCPGQTTGSCDSTVTMPVVTTPTAVQVLSFGARAERGRVAVRWRTAAENNLVGFNIWRRSVGTEQRVNRLLIGARGAHKGSGYRFVDRSVRRGGTYTYLLEMVNRDGSRSWYGSARVRTVH